MGQAYGLERMSVGHINREFKARCADPERIRALLHEHEAEFIGVDEQRDTYFNVPKGRLKLREGNIEHALIRYERQDIAGHKTSHVILYHPLPDPALREILADAYGIRAIVEKRREIFFIDNVKFHIDEVAGLGSFIEVEAIQRHAEHDEEFLERQCSAYAALLGVHEADYIDVSYVDLIDGLAERHAGT